MDTSSTEYVSEDGTETIVLEVTNGVEVREIYTVDACVCDDRIAYAGDKDEVEEYLHGRGTELTADGYR